MTIITPRPYILASTNVSDGTLPPTYNPNTNYSQGNEVYIPEVFGIFKAKTSIKNKHPLDYPDLWEFVDTINSRRMFDQYFNTQTVNNGSIVIEIEANITDIDKIIDSIYIGNIEGETLKIEAFDPSDTLIETKTYQLHIIGCQNWYDYFSMNWFDRKIKTVLYLWEGATLIPPAKYRITLSAKDNNTPCKIGITLFGKRFNYGITQYDAKVNVLDYSKIDEKENGQTFLKKGLFLLFKIIQIKFDIFLDLRIFL